MSRVNALIHVVCVIGTRPEAIKMAPVIAALRAESWVRCTVAVTAQHRELLDTALDVFGLKADIDLDLMRPDQSLGSITGHAFLALEPVLRDLKADLVLAQGDTTTVMVTAVSCFYQGIPFGHVEAGLRTGRMDNPFPEEANRVIAGRVACLHFAPTKRAAASLAAEGVARDAITITGNTVIDALFSVSDRAPAPDVRLPDSARLLLVTAHRREHFGQAMVEAMRGLREAVDARPDLHVLFPVHPNPNVTSAVDLCLRDHPRIHLRPPMDYLAFAGAMAACDLILTDSGGVQEEGPALGKPVLVMRTETERPEAVDLGVVRLVGSDGVMIRTWIERLLDDPVLYRSMVRTVSPYGDGQASQRIVQAIAARFDQMPSRPSIAEFDAGY